MIILDLILRFKIILSIQQFLIFLGLEVLVNRALFEKLFHVSSFFNFFSQVNRSSLLRKTLMVFFFIVIWRFRFGFGFIILLIGVYLSKGLLNLLEFLFRQFEVALSFHELFLGSFPFFFICSWSHLLFCGKGFLLSHLFFLNSISDLLLDLNKTCSSHRILFIWPRKWVQRHVLIKFRNESLINQRMRRLLLIR